MVKAPKNLRVLLVDDEAELLETLSAIFLRFKFQVMTAGGGQAAWDLLLKHEFDVVLSDIRMPDFDGIKLLTQVRERSHDKPTFLFMSGHTDISLESLYDLGADGFFSKPMGASTIRDAIVRAAVPRQMRWTQIVTDNERLQIKASLDSFSSALEKKTLALGRGGFYAGFPIPDARDGKAIDFDVTFSDGDLRRLAGQGLVRWNRQGMGVEITALESDCREIISSWIDKHNPRAFIPMKPT